MSDSSVDSLAEIPPSSPMEDSQRFCSSESGSSPSDIFSANYGRSESEGDSRSTGHADDLGLSASNSSRGSGDISPVFPSRSESGTEQIVHSPALLSGVGSSQGLLENNDKENQGLQSEEVDEVPDDIDEPDAEYISKLKFDPYAPISSCIMLARLERRRQRRARLGLARYRGKAVGDYMDLAKVSPTMEHMAVALFYDFLSGPERARKLNLAYRGQQDTHIVDIYGKVLAYYDTGDDHDFFGRIKRALLVSNRFLVRQEKVRHNLMKHE